MKKEKEKEKKDRKKHRLIFSICVSSYKERERKNPEKREMDTPDSERARNSKRSYILL